MSDKEFSEVYYRRKAFKFCIFPGKDHISSTIRSHIMPDSNIIQQLETFSFEDKIMIDVGAYLGTWSIPLARSFDRVIAFEPQIEPFEMLNESIKMNDAKVDAYNIALGSKQACGIITNNVNTNFAGSKIHKVKNGDITISTLDHEIKSARINPEDIGLIKIDVEGMELDVLKGSEYVLEKGYPYVYVELHDLPNTGKTDNLVGRFMEERKYERVRTLDKDKVLWAKSMG